MRILLSVLSIGFWALVLFAEDTKQANYRYASEDSVAVYGGEAIKASETPRFFLKKGDRVKVVMEASDRDSVTMLDGRTGWIEKKLLASSNKHSLYLEELKVFGVLDNPDPVYILDYENSEYKPIRVFRDFIFDPELMKNIVKENFEWENEIYYYKGYEFSPEAVKPPERLTKQKE